MQDQREVSAAKGERTGFSMDRNSRYPRNGADVSPLDFWAFGKVKTAVAGRRPRTIRGVKNVVREVFAKITPEEAMKVMQNGCR